MFWIIALVALLGMAVLLWYRSIPAQIDLSHLPEHFVVFDLETSGLKAQEHEIIEIGAIRVNRDSDHHETFEVLVQPSKSISKKITEITGISNNLLMEKGEEPESALDQFLNFIGDLPLVAYNADFDVSFLKAAIKKHKPGFELKNKTSCALKLARRAYPGRTSYKLPDIANDGGLSSDNTHRALGDCKRALTVYMAASTALSSRK